jgi:Spy/CpxP family protein refolding chaperone
MNLRLTTGKGENTMKIKLRQKTDTRIVMLVVAVCLAIIIIPYAVGASPWSEEREKRGGMPDKGRHRQPLGFWQDQQAIEQLELTDEQVQQLQDADYTSREKHLEVKTRLDQLRLQMEKAFSSEARDKKAIRQLAKEMAGVDGQLFVQKIEDRLSLDSILTSDQIRKLERTRMYRKRGGRARGMRPDPHAEFAGRPGDCDCRRTK